VPREDYILHRLLLSSDIHLGPNARIFVQLGSELERGDVRTDSPLTETGAILPRASLSSSFRSVTDATVGSRIGRQEMMFGSNRLVDIREGPNIRQSFDGAAYMGEVGGNAHRRLLDSTGI